ncbi:MAG: hypothetical protein ACI4GD_00530 [Lachnospiraceae bacterium]
MIETKEFTAKYDGGTYYKDATFKLAKLIAAYIAEKMSAQLIEYSDGCVIRKDGQVDICVFGKMESTTTYSLRTSIVKQNNDSLSDDTTSIEHTTDFYDVVQRSVTIGNKSESGTERTVSINATIYTNSDTFVIYGNGGFIIGCFCDEDNEIHLSVNNYNVYDKDRILNSIESIYNVSLSLQRENADQIAMTDVFLRNANVCSKRMKKLYSIMKHSNIQEGSRYRFDGYEYYALSDTVLFRLEGGD